MIKYIDKESFNDVLKVFNKTIDELRVLIIIKEIENRSISDKISILQNKYDDNYNEISEATKTLNNIKNIIGE